MSAESLAALQAVMPEIAKHLTADDIARACAEARETIRNPDDRKMVILRRLTDLARSRA